MVGDYLINFNINKEHTCCFSGHRPEKLCGSGDLNSPELRRLLSVLRLAIENAVEEGYTTFLTGMARGIDMWSARFVLELKVKHPNLQLVCAIPYKGQNKSLKGAEKFDYNYIIESANDVICLSEVYTKTCMKDRNYFMVDNSSKLIAVVSNYRSGTGQTINYARKKLLDTKIIDTNENNSLIKAIF